jgi:hypothetical protein
MLPFALCITCPYNCCNTTRKPMQGADGLSPTVGTALDFGVPLICDCRAANHLGVELCAYPEPKSKTKVEPKCGWSRGPS